MGPTCSIRITRVLTYSGSTSRLFHFIYETFTLFGLVFHLFLFASQNHFFSSPNTKKIASFSLGSTSFARHYLRYRFFSFFSCGYLDVSVPHVTLSHTTLLICGLIESLLFELPHSDIYGSLDICSSP